MVKLLPNVGADAAEVVFVASVLEFVSSFFDGFAAGMTVTDVSFRFGTIELFDDSNDFTSLSRDECDVATLLLAVELLNVVLVASPTDAPLTSGTVDCCAALSLDDFLLSFDFLT